MENPFKTINEKLDQLQNSFDTLNNQTKEPPPENDLTNVKGAAKILDTTSGTIYNLVHEKRIPHHKRGKKLYFFKSELIDWVRRGKKKTKEELIEEVNQNLSDLKKAKGRKGQTLNTPSKEQGKDTDNSHSEKQKATLETFESQGENLEEATEETGQLHYLQNEGNLNHEEEE